MTTGKIIALTGQIFVGEVISLLFNMLSRLVIAFLPRSKRLNFMAAVTICSSFGAQEIKSVTVSIVSPIYLPWSNATGCYELMGPDAVILFFECWVLSQLFHSALTFIKRLFSSSLLSAMRVVSSAYVKLLVFLLEILIPACASSSPTFLMMYSAYKLNKQDDNIQPCYTPFLIWNQSVVSCPILTVASWPAYRFFRSRSVGLVFPSLRIFHSLL